MSSCWQIFWLECLSLWRSRTLIWLALSAFAWMMILPMVVHGDGTAEGLREISIRYSLGGVLVLLALFLLSAATGSIAKERSARRLQLTMVRPVRYVGIVLAKWLAYVMAGAAVLALSFLVMLGRVEATARCSRVISPRLPSPSEEAREMYAAYMADPETPVEIKKAKKSVVMRILQQRAIDHYQTLATNTAVAWEFPECKPQAVRIRFTNQFEMRERVLGHFRFGEQAGVISNITQAVVKIPLERGVEKSEVGEERLVFYNEGQTALMIRPRKDIQLLETADEFWKNAIRAYWELVAVLALLIAFGLFLSAGLGRAVALFTAIVVMVIAEMSPSVVDQYPDALETKVVDRVGLYMTRFVVAATRPMTALTPLTALSNDEYIEVKEVVKTVILDGFLISIGLAILSASVMPRKQGEL